METATYIDNRDRETMMEYQQDQIDALRRQVRYQQETIRRLREYVTDEEWHSIHSELNELR